MPFRRKFAGRKRIFPKRKRKVPFWRKAVGAIPRMVTSFGGLARGLAMVKNLINTEPKMIDTKINTAADTTGFVTLLTGIAQGTTDVTRIGNSVLSKYIHARMRFTINSAATRTNLGWILFMDKQNAGGTAPTVANLLQTSDPEGHINRDFSDRFAILRRGTVSLNITNNQIVNKTVFVNLSRLHIKFDGTTAAQGDCAENHLYFAFISTEGTNTPNCFAEVRYMFYDN